MPEPSGLTIRQHERQAIRLDVELVVADEQRRQVRFSAGSGAQGQAVVRGTADDISPGGMGLCFGQFVPRNCMGTVRVYGRTPVDVAADGTPIFEVIFEHEVRVRRVWMSSHDPAYSLGVSFVDPEPDLEMRVRAVLRLAVAEPDVAAPEGGGGGA